MWVLTSCPFSAHSQPLEEPPLYYDKKADRDESERNDPNYVIVSHRYQVLRYLPSPVEAVNVSFLVPVNVTDAGGRQLRVVDVYKPAAIAEGRPLACSIETGYFLAAVSRTNKASLEIADVTEYATLGSVAPVGRNIFSLLHCIQFNGLLSFAALVTQHSTMVLGGCSEL